MPYRPANQAPFVYFIGAVGGGNIKIGCSVNPPKRLKTLMAWSPVRLELLTHAPGANAVEGALQWRFRQTCDHGEWFRPSPALRALIAEVRSAGAIPGVDEAREWDATFAYRPHGGRRLFALLHDHGISRREMADFIGMNVVSLGAWRDWGVEPKKVVPVLEFLRSRGIAINVLDLSDQREAA